ncbi:TPA: hypothetical protein HA239_03820 [Candidatus Woesearchaeota archaeon]|nr:hypothetical protein QT06_C0001G0819 [archaeon GW2011_AR15]MBS3103402.1 hypothetical protein [Candidatus Woesearchaeota archaeon]HIH41519.1 hypothetical protein [Candidatus Woesearchaeota archaeon]
MTHGACCGDGCCGCSGDSCCDDNQYTGRKFLTKEEKISKLESYKEWLDNESKGVKEAIDKLKKA